ncbi:MAG: galactokinase [Acutalibacteraceae bacterium]
MTQDLKALYGAEAEAQRARYAALNTAFAEAFGAAEALEYFSAPGRTEVGGNHTDHNNGKVLAAAVNLDVIAAVKKTENGVIRLKSAGYPMDTVDTAELSVQESEKERSAALIRGVCARLKALGYKVGGFDAVTASRVLKCSGLSSSAAFEVLVVTILSHLYNGGAIAPVEAAQISKYAENVYFGKPSGLLDQMAASVGGFTTMDFADPAAPKIEKIDFDLEKLGYALCVVDTGGNHADLTGEYAAVPAEMKAVAAEMGASVLREVDEAAFYAAIPSLRKTVGDRAVLRAIHFFSDNRIVDGEVGALKSGDFEEFKRLVIASGRSSAVNLQNVFAVVNPQEQGLSLALALIERQLSGRGAWRVHGGGFAGTVQAYVPLDMLEGFRAEMEAVFGAGACYVLSIRSVGGTKVQI